MKRIKRIALKILILNFAFFWIGPWILVFVGGEAMSLVSVGALLWVLIPEFRGQRLARSLN